MIFFAQRVELLDEEQGTGTVVLGWTNRNRNPIKLIMHGIYTTSRTRRNKRQKQRKLPPKYTVLCRLPNVDGIMTSKTFPAAVQQHVWYPLPVGTTTIVLYVLPDSHRYISYVPGIIYIPVGSLWPNYTTITLKIRHPAPAWQPCAPTRNLTLQTILLQTDPR